MASRRLQIEKNSNDIPEISELYPTIIGFYSIDDVDGYTPTAKNLKYVCPDSRSWSRRHRNFDLNQGLNTYIRKSMNEGGSDDKIDFVLKWISENNYLRKISDENANEECYFVCLRGLLKTVMKTPFLQGIKDSWIIDAVKVKNIIFLCVFRSEEEIKNNQTFRESEYYGQKFEQCMLTNDPEQEPDLRAPVNANKDFCLVFRTKIDNHNLIYGGETDGLELDNKIRDNEIINLDPSSFVELKTSHTGIHKTAKFKKMNLLNCWTQTYLSGIENIIWGFRDGDGKLRYINRYQTSTIPREAQNMWSPRVGQGFLNEFLDFVKTTMQEVPDMTYYEFSRNTLEHSNFVVAKKLRPENREIIPKWFEREIKLFSKTFE